MTLARRSPTTQQATSLRLSIPSPSTTTSTTSPHTSYALASTTSSTKSARLPLHCRPTSSTVDSGGTPSPTSDGNNHPPRMYIGAPPAYHDAERTILDINTDSDHTHQDKTLMSLTMTPTRNHHSVSLHRLQHPPTL
jgi:hypothetical protein